MFILDENKNQAENIGIWRYADFYNELIKKENRLYLGDGNTPIVQNEDINREFSVKNLFFKREDKNESGSFKGRSIAYQVSLAKQRGERNLVISSSGNAGIALSAYCMQADLASFVFISPKTDESKIEELQKYNSIIIKTNRPIRFANYASARYKIPNLRPSLDDDSIEGFKSIAFEISDEIGDVDAIFTFVTSGSSFIGIYRGFEIYFNKNKINKIPKMFAVQSGGITSALNSVEIDYKITDQEISAGKLGVKNTRRKKDLLDIISKTNGAGIYVENSEIESSQNDLFRNDLITSPEGCASFAAFVKVQKKYNFKKVVCIFSGKVRNEQTKESNVNIYEADSLEDVDKIIKKFKR